MTSKVISNWIYSDFLINKKLKNLINWKNLYKNKNKPINRRTNSENNNISSFFLVPWDESFKRYKYYKKTQKICAYKIKIPQDLVHTLRSWHLVIKKKHKHQWSLNNKE
jgi:hypothetical protein